jgi:hypothetical protein
METLTYDEAQKKASEIHPEMFAILNGKKWVFVLKTNFTEETTHLNTHSIPVISDPVKLQRYAATNGMKNVPLELVARKLALDEDIENYVKQQLSDVLVADGYPAPPHQDYLTIPAMVRIFHQRKLTLLATATDFYRKELIEVRTLIALSKI